MTTTEQTRLAFDDDAPADGTGAAVSVGVSLAALAHIETPEADPELTANLKSRGLLEPIILGFHEDDAQFYLISGRRRLAAARKLGWKIISATTNLRRHPQLDTLSENIHRARNLAVEYEAILQLQRQGMSDADVRREARISAAAFASLVSLYNLTPALRALMKAGKMANTVGLACARLPLDDIAALSARVESGELARVTAKDIKKLRSAQAASASAELEEEAPDMFASRWPDEVRATVAALHQQVKSKITEAGDLATQVAQLMEQIEEAIDQDDTE